MSELIRFPEVVPDEVRVDASRWSMTYLADGEVRRWEGEGADVLSPVCTPDLRRIPIGRLPMLDAETAMGALAAARRAWDDGRGPWATLPVAGRVAATQKFVELMQRTREDVVRLLMWEIGKTRKDAESEFDRTVVYIRDTIEALKELDRAGGRFVVQEGFVAQIRRSPLGVVLCMGPYNYPINETFTTLIPAVVMGNAVVSKLPRYGGLSQLPLLEAFAEAFPPGVVNVIQGDGATVIGPMMASGDVDALAFIGSSRVANIIEKQHPRPNRLRVITGLEAKNPGVVLPDADLDATVKECVAGALGFNGQRCTALKLMLVHESRAEEFVARFAAAVDALPAGMPWDPAAKLTPLPEEDKCAALAALVDDAVQKGARVVNRDGGRAHGTFFRPAVVWPATPEMKLWTVEQFGPIAPIASWRDLSEIEEFFRKSSYGQQVSLFGRDPKQLGALVDVLANQVARININTQCRRGPDTFPFTGRKDSAEGTLSVTDALRCFSIRTVAATTTADENKKLVTDIVTGRLSSFISTDYLL
jgi:glyceraldehyde-3-phosphate dehydrogenase (NADP+)